MGGKPSIPQTEVESIVRRYKAGESTEVIGQSYGKHRDTIRSLLLRNGVKTNQKGGNPPLATDLVEAIVERYRGGEGSTSIASDLGIDKRSVFNVLIREGVGTRPVGDRKGKIYHMPDAAVRAAARVRLGPSKHRQKPFDEHVFDVLTEESAYWIGFLMADGCISAPIERPNRRLFLQLALKDRDHLDRFRAFLNASNDIGFGSHLDPAGNEKQHCFLAVTSNHLTETLMNYGVTPRKTATAKVCDTLANDRHFWRGVVDGDGCVYSLRKFYVAGSKELMTQFVEFARPLEKNGSYWLRPQPGCVRVMANVAGAVAVLRALYTNCSIALPRKREAALKP